MEASHLNTVLSYISCAKYRPSGVTIGEYPHVKRRKVNKVWFSSNYQQFSSYRFYNDCRWRRPRGYTHEILYSTLQAILPPVWNLCGITSCQVLVSVVLVWNQHYVVAMQDAIVSSIDSMVISMTSPLADTTVARHVITYTPVASINSLISRSQPLTSSRRTHTHWLLENRETQRKNTGYTNYTRWSLEVST